MARSSRSVRELLADFCDQMVMRRSIARGQAPRWVIGRLSIRIALVVIGMGLWGTAAAGPASAHATFVSPAVADVGTDVDFTLDVPNERDEETFNVVVRVRIPDGWTPVSCRAFPTWTCSVLSGEIDFRKDAGADAAQDETFLFTARPTRPGRSVFPVVQIYNSTEDVLWADTATVEVRDQSPTTVTTTVMPAASGPDPVGPVTDPTAATTETTVVAPSTTAVEAPPSTTTARISPDGDRDAALAASADSSTSSHSGKVILVAMLAVVALGLGATAVLHRVRRQGRG